MFGLCRYKYKATFQEFGCRELNSQKWVDSKKYVYVNVTFILIFLFLLPFVSWNIFFYFFPITYFEIKEKNHYIFFFFGGERREKCEMNREISILNNKCGFDEVFLSIITFIFLSFVLLCGEREERPIKYWFTCENFWNRISSAIYWNLRSVNSNEARNWVLYLKPADYLTI